MSIVKDYGRFGNHFFRYMAMSFISKKHNLFIVYENNDSVNKIKDLGIYLYNGNIIYNKTISLIENTVVFQGDNPNNNYYNILNSNSLNSNIDPNNEICYCQTRYVSNLIYNYMRIEEIKNNIINLNQFKGRYNNNNDCFIHVRLTDAEQYNPGFSYYDNILSQLSYNNIYLATDDNNHNIILQLLEKYPKINILNYEIVDLIKFASTNKYIILSHGSFSAMIGYFSLFSNVYYAPYNHPWCGDLFSIPEWKISNKLNIIDNLSEENDLTTYAFNKYSQRGHDGIINKIMDILNIKEGVFIEFEGWDGIHLSNTRYLYEKGWKGCFIEADTNQSIQCSNNYKNSNILSINEYIYPTNIEGVTIDNIYNNYLTGQLGFDGKEIDLLSIDIDGRDYEIFENMNIKPKLIIIEGGFAWHPSIKHKIPYKFAKYLQQPLHVMFQLARKKGYEPICFNKDSFLLRKDLYDKYVFFQSIKNDPETLWNKAYYSDIIFPECERLWLNNFRLHNIIMQFEDPMLDLFQVYQFNNKIRLGVDRDGGYVIGELEGGYDSYISAGVSNEESFTRDFINKYNTDKTNNYAFDGTIIDYPYHYTNNISFIKKNIGGINNENLTNLIDIINPYNNIFLKMDIEGGEFIWLDSITENDLKKFKQIVIEFHGVKDDKWDSTLDIKINCFKKLYKTHYIIHVHGNNHCNLINEILPEVIELTYVRKDYFNQIPELNTTLLPIKGLDYPNCESIAEFDLNMYPFVHLL
jgi:hypothetical protein